MNHVQGGPATEPFFLKNGMGQRFCLLHRPVGACRGAMLYVQPFAEELNRSRRMAALQAREIAALGYAVLQIDLYGCGDSSGDFGDARWDLWKQDLAAGIDYLQQQFGQPITLWGLRLGALLALDYARTAHHPLAAMILWQPVLNGSAYLTQFLRLRVAGALLADNALGQGGTSSLRDALRAGQTLEIVGYDLAPELAAAIDALNASDMMTPDVPVFWFEAASSASQVLSPATARVMSAWKQQGVELTFYPVQGPQFWTTSEITVAPHWLTATSTALRMKVHEH
jgi:exosortase A-associated hydrolase 2